MGLWTSERPVGPDPPVLCGEAAHYILYPQGYNMMQPQCNCVSIICSAAIRWVDQNNMPDLQFLSLQAEAAL